MVSRIFGWSAGFSGCEYYRLTLPLQALAELGHETKVSSALRPADYQDYDVVIGQRVCNPGPFALWQKICRDPDTLAVYEIDDNLFCLHDEHAPSVRDFWTRERLETVGRAASMADVVTVTTQHLAEVMRKFNREVHIIPNFIDKSVLGIPALLNKPKTGETVIGYQAASNHGRDFREAWPSIERLLRREPSAYFASLGTSYVDSTTETVAAKMRHVPWIERDWDRYYRSVASFDVGIAPLSDNRFNSSKSHVKALEYAAVGIPTVASRMLPYVDFIQDGQTGFLIPPGSDHLWHKRLRELANEPILRQSMGDAAWRLAERNTIQENVGLWRVALSLTLSETPSLAV